jgi:hypothetical protein
MKKRAKNSPSKQQKQEELCEISNDYPMGWPWLTKHT